MAWYVVDGMDGSGKSTVADILRDELESRGRSVMVIAHPNRGTAVGRLELAFLRGDSKLDVVMSTVLYVADVLHSICVMRGRRGRAFDDVVFVRYSMAVAYLPDRLCARAYGIVTRVLPSPDVKVLVDVDPGAALQRIFDRGEELEVFETEERLAAVRRRMLGISDDWVVLDNRGDLRELSEQVAIRVLGGTDEAARSHASVRRRDIAPCGVRRASGLRRHPCAVPLGAHVHPARCGGGRHPDGRHIGGRVAGDGDRGPGGRRPALLREVRQHRRGRGPQGGPRQAAGLRRGLVRRRDGRPVRDRRSSHHDGHDAQLRDQHGRGGAHKHQMEDKHPRHRGHGAVDGPVPRLLAVGAGDVRARSPGRMEPLRQAQAYPRPAGGRFRLRIHRHRRDFVAVPPRPGFTGKKVRARCNPRAPSRGCPRTWPPCRRSTPCSL